MKNIDLKSFLIGGLLATTLFLLMGAQTPDSTKSPRYQLISHDETANTALVFNPQTGAVARIYFKGTATVSNERGEPFINGSKIREAINK